MPKILEKLRIKTIGSVDKPANQNAVVVLCKRDDSEDVEKAEPPMKSEDGKKYPKGDYAYAPSDNVSEWKLRLTAEPGGPPDSGIVGAACAALGPGFRGQKVEISADDLASVKSKVRVAWKKANPDKAADDMPEAIKKGGEAMDPAEAKNKLWDIVKALLGFEGGDVKDLVTMVADRDKNDLLWKLTSALENTIDGIATDAVMTTDEKQTAIAQVVQQFFSLLIGGGIAKAGRKISTSRLDLLKQMQAMLAKLIAEAETMPPDNEMIKNQGRGSHVAITEDIIKALTPEMQSHIADLVKKAGLVDELTAKVAELEKKVVGEQKEESVDIWKGVHPDIRKQFEDMQKKADDAEKLAKAEVEKREWAELLKRTATYPNVAPAEELASLLKQAYATSKETGDKLEAVFKTVNERVEQGNLFKEAGRSGGPTAVGGNAWAKIEAKAAGLVEKSGNMTKEQAVAKILELEPQLYAEYENERISKGVI